jgi:L-ascorbate metabolism protein UlaG (beta-lactamase superfamily)
MVKICDSFSSINTLKLRTIHLFAGLFIVYSSPLLLAHEKQAAVTYLANEGVMISAGNVKVLFDPFFHNDYGIYQLVPEKIINSIMSNTSPYNGINAIFVSHAHDDHFAEEDMLAYMLTHKTVELVAPTQAIVELQKLDGFTQIEKRITRIELAYKQKPISFTVKGIKVDAVRIPHAGWPGRAEISNIVYRVTLPALVEQDALTFIHMGDADPNDSHFRPLAEFWNVQKTTVAFPPYWFFLSATGNYILDYRINAETSIGVHVPKDIPVPLIMSKKSYFSEPGEVINVENKAH